MKTLITLLLALFAFTAASQDYYWVGGSGDWSDFANHWATTSGGSTFHTSEPSSTNDVYFDANSFSSSSQVVSLDVAANCNSMDWTGVVNFPSIDGNGNEMNIFGSLTLAADMTADFEIIEFESTTTGNTITTNGSSLGSSSNTRFNGIGGEWLLQDNFTTSILFVVAGTFTTNNHNVNSGSFFQTSGSSAKTINLGSSTITSERWWMFGSNQTINAGTSKMIVSSFYGDDTADGPFTYYDVEFTNYGRLYNTSTFNEITIPAGLDFQMRSGDVFTINNLVADGTKHEPIIIKSITQGSEATFNQAGGSVTVSFVELEDIHATGGATFTANDAVDNGNNTGWTINGATPLDYYWVGNGGDWTDFASHWATTSGGSTMHTDYPGKLDDVYFDANSFSSGGQTVANDLDDGANFHDMDWTGVTNTPTIDAPISFELKAYGSVTFTAGMDKDIHTLRFSSDDAGETFTALGSGSNSFVYFVGDGTYDLLSDINATTIRQEHGTVNYNAVSINCAIDFEIGNGAGSPTLNLGSSSITCRDFNVHPSTTPTVAVGTSTVTISRDLDGNGVALNDVTMDGAGEILGSNTFEFLTITEGSSVAFEAGETLTVNQGITMTGTKANPINITSSQAGTQGTISMASGTVNATYLILQDNVATGGATFNADETVDNGNNTGWNITALTGSDYYWVGNSGNWSDFANHWATTSGGSTFETTVPGVLDNVIFDANSFSSAGEIVTIDSDAANLQDLDASLSTQDFTISGSSKEMNIYGSLDAPSSVTLSVGDVNFLSVNSETLDFNGGPGINSDFFFLSSGTWTLSSSVSVRELTIENGTLDTNGQAVDVSNSFNFLSSANKVLDLGTSALSVGSISANTASNVTINGGSSDLTLSQTLLLNTGTNSITLNDVTYAVNALMNDGLIYDDITVNKFTIEAGKTLKPVGDLTITTNELIAVGTVSDPIVLEPQTGGSSLTFSQASGTVDADYLELEEVTATGGATFNAFNSIDNGNVFGWIFHKDPQTISFPAISDVTFGTAPFALSATATSGLTVTFSIVSGPATVSGSTITLTGVGTVQVQATQAGDINFDPAPSVTNTFEVLSVTQTITFDALADVTYGDADFDLTATASSGLPITYNSSDAAVATITGSTVTIVGAGSTTITASQSGDATNNPAVDVQQVLTVNQADQTITFDTIADYDIDTETDPITLGATASSGLAVSYTVVGLATLNGDELTPTDLGTVTVTASQVGDSNFNPAPDVIQEFEVISPLGLPFDQVAVKFYPNPVKEYLTIDLAEHGYEIELRSLSGGLVGSYELEKHTTIDLRTNAKGLYLLVLKKGNAIKGMKRLIVE